MHQQNPYIPNIPSVRETVARPLWSVMIPHYNCVEYLRETLASVLTQAPSSDVMEIVVVDNQSTEGDPEAVVAELGQGRVKFYQQQRNVGMLKNFQTCLELSRGQLIHILHSDDCVREGFYQKMTETFSKNPDIGAAFCRSVYIDMYGQSQGLSSLELPESGILPSNWIKRIAEICCISVPSLAVVRREVYEKLGGLDSRCGLSSDWEMWVRIFANYPVWFEAEPLAMWRIHASSNNVTNAKSMTFIQENFQTIEIIFQSHLHKLVNSKLHRKVKKNCAFLALEAAKLLMQKGDISGARAYLQTALQYSRSWKVLLAASRIILVNGLLAILQYSSLKVESRVN
ncbi:MULTISPECIES: glycosyltransferase family 2 protein [Nostocales]|nr:glycosyltransferase [Tolypothrix bouteillei]